ncbi:hypothetical protein ANN_24344 [Periplaneta americana]|uniref:Uncharacterized protein n=1 Tax=Periplaneta americana TaxID=6978 RepID=A0ABQ8S3K4_PERAM|nr:hypothetical protein ANN_24344 [Periplaneta americana]
MDPLTNDRSVAVIYRYYYRSYLHKTWIWTHEAGYTLLIAEKGFLLFTLNLTTSLTRPTEH